LRSAPPRRPARALARRPFSRGSHRAAVRRIRSAARAKARPRRAPSCRRADRRPLRTIPRRSESAILRQEGGRAGNELVAPVAQA
jgi:hypothetical protein